EDNLFLKLTDMKLDYDHDLYYLIIYENYEYSSFWKDTAFGENVVVIFDDKLKNLQIKNIPEGQYMIRICSRLAPERQWLRFFLITGKNQVEWDFKSDRLKYRGSRDSLSSLYSKLPTISDDGSAYKYLESGILEKRMLPASNYLSFIFPGLGHPPKSFKKRVFVTLGVSAIALSYIFKILERDAYIDYLSSRSNFDKKFENSQILSRMHNTFLISFFCLIGISGFDIYFTKNENPEE
ncbi:MAG: hypothetical protein ABIA63_14735, partial [bacterium]